MNKNRQVKNFLIDKRFQLKYTLMVIAISTVISVALGTFLYQAHRESSRVSSMDDPDLDGAMSAELRRQDRQVIVYLVAYLGGLVLCLSVLGIVATHKIAGPAYAMRKTLSAIADNQFPVVRPLRKGDELRSVGEELRRMADTLRQREQLEHDRLQRAIAMLHSDPSKQTEVLPILEKILKEKAERL